MSKIMMPILVLLAIVVTIYSVTRPGALAGVKYFLIPNMKNFSFMTIVAAMGQMFYSLSIAMGILTPTVLIQIKIWILNNPQHRLKSLIQGLQYLPD